MRVLILIVLVFAISGCGTRQDTTGIEHAPARVAASETPFPTEEGYPTIPTVDAKPLTKNQKRNSTPRCLLKYVRYSKKQTRSRSSD